MIQLRYFDPSGRWLDTVIIYRDGNCSQIPARTAWVEVTTIGDTDEDVQAALDERDRMALEEVPRSAADAMDTIIEGLRGRP